MRPLAAIFSSLAASRVPPAPVEVKHQAGRWCGVWPWLAQYEVLQKCTAAGVDVADLCVTFEVGRPGARADKAVFSALDEKVVFAASCAACHTLVS